MKKYLLILTATLLSINSDLMSQEYSNNSLKVGLGIGMNEGLKEMGMGTLVSFGYQKSVLNDRLRINPNFMTGGFFPFGITDTRDQYYRITSLGVDGYFDVIKYKPFSLFVVAGGLINYTRGLLGTGGWPEAGNNISDYLFKLYYGGHLAWGIRVNQPKSRLAYEITPLNICFGNDQFFMGFIKVAIDIKLNIKDLSQK
ncbi:MAG: hypothetical protein IPJ16_02140 [Bacteroidales bacterium]|nr:hypothetical protein [Bacteroidales bacterium]